MAKDEEKNSQASVAPNEGEVKAKQEQTSAKEPAAKAGETEKVADLQKQVEELTKQLDDQKDQNLRAQAEMQNMTKRFKKEQAQLLKYDGQDLAKGILPVLDNLKRALEIEVEDENGQQLKKGIQMVHDHLEKALADHDIKEVEALNQPFDPTTQQAVQTVAASGDQKPDTVVQVLQAGYVLHDRVLRPAMVIVAQ